MLMALTHNGESFSSPTLLTVAPGSPDAADLISPTDECLAPVVDVGVAGILVILAAAINYTNDLTELHKTIS